MVASGGQLVVQDASKHTQDDSVYEFQVSFFKRKFSL